MSNEQGEKNGEIFTRTIPSLPSVTERYFKHKLYRSQEGCNQDLLLLVHSNQLVLVTLSPRHDILAGAKTPIVIDYNANNRINRLDNLVIGKSKKGGQRVHKHSKLCTIECQDGSKYEIKAGINGKLIQVNKALVDNVSLLTTRTFTDGWIAMILPPFQSKEIDNLVDYQA